MEIRRKLKMMVLPNFLNLKVRKETEGFYEDVRIPVWDLTEEEAIAYAEELKDAFIAHYKKKVKDSINQNFDVNPKK